MARQLEPWGGALRLPRFFSRLLRQRDRQDTPERVREARGERQPPKSVLENADRALFGPLSPTYREDHPKRR